MAGDVCARVHLLGAGLAAGRRSPARGRDLVRRSPAHGGPHLPPAHRLCLVAGAEVAHRADGFQRRGLRRRRRGRAHGAVELPDQRIPAGRRALPLGLQRPPLRRRPRSLADRRASGQSDRLRPESAQPEHRDLTRRKSARSRDMPASAVDPQHVVVTEPVRDSDHPVHLTYVELLDGVYAPIGLRLPSGQGPFPLVLFAAGNGGGGMAVVRDFTQNRSWTQDQFLKSGYAVAWLRYRAEVDYAYDRIGKLIEDRRQNRQLLNRGPLEYEDVIAIVEYAKTLPAIDGDRIGYMGMSHGGEMAFKIASEYHGVRAMIASEPAAHEFLRLRPDASAQINPETGLLNVEKMLMREAEKVRPRITDDVARARMDPIRTPIFVQGRNSDELQGIFRVCYDLLAEMGKDTKWATYEHDVHGFVYVGRNEKGVYAPDAVQVQSVKDSIAWFDKYLK